MTTMNWDLTRKISLSNSSICPPLRLTTAVGAAVTAEDVAATEVVRNVSNAAEEREESVVTTEETIEESAGAIAGVISRTQITRKNNVEDAGAEVEAEVVPTPTKLKEAAVEVIADAQKILISLKGINKNTRKM